MALTINTIPDDCLRAILSNFTPKELHSFQVCTHWQTIIGDLLKIERQLVLLSTRNIWDSFSYSIRQFGYHTLSHLEHLIIVVPANKQAVKQILSKYCGLRKLILGFSDIAALELTSYLAECCPNLETLTLIDNFMLSSNLISAEIRSAIQSLQNLKNLHLVNQIHTRYGPEIQSVLQPLNFVSLHLTQLNLTNCTVDLPGLLRMLGPQCQRLTLGNVTYKLEDLQSLSACDLPVLTQLSIRNLSCIPDKIELKTNILLHFISKRFKLLQCLDLSFVSNKSRRSMDYLVSFRQLKHLRIRFVPYAVLQSTTKHRFLSVTKLELCTQFFKVPTPRDLAFYLKCFPNLEIFLCEHQLPNVLPKVRFIKPETKEELFVKSVCDHW